MKQEKKSRFPRKHLVLSIISLIMVAVFSFGMVFANNYAKLINQALGLSSTKTIRPEGAEEQRRAAPGQGRQGHHPGPLQHQYPGVRHRLCGYQRIAGCGEIPQLPEVCQRLPDAEGRAGRAFRRDRE